MNQTLLYLIHPALERSRINKRLFLAAQTLKSLTTQDLYEAYPDFNIDILREQALLRSHDSIIFQFPLFWYSSPSLLKEWLDLVLQYGWAFGKDGTALAGKRVRLALTTGGSAHSYTSNGHNRFTIEELLRPIQSTFELCGMQYEPPFLTHDALHLANEKLEAQATAYKNWIQEI